ncbi:nuclear membrane fusion protein Kar5 [Aspergillus costaricaensis CBS 115574]|uniref:Nuclear membrane fusion protein Kar5 n=1 Tax=Aspergillus costaricaensis CBS 115574 TaxID=1448317 RepID=A0ACD1IHP7_9EURO|nr:nuclear membrane fusion protein Kar5 [Aspergillus costaricaensis CBS 115574]RAK90156.1 nuclear membrane fusion protein Kar5 [Aspergillus costaricaensis CBS 115574]
MRLPQKKGLFGLSTGYKTHFNTAETVAKGQLESCLRSLESRPQWWTSYSNSRQNAVVICQAARFENEREEIIELHRSIIEGTIKLDHGLQEALKVAATGISQYKEFLQSVEVMRSKLVVSMEETEMHFKTRLENLILDMGVHVGSILEPVVSTIRNLHSSTASLDKDIANAAEGVNNLRDILKLVQDEGIAWGQQQAVTRQQDALAFSDLVSDVQGDMEKLSGTVANFESALEWLAGRFVHILEQEQDISKRLSNLEIALSGSQIIAEDLRNAQLGQNELQEHLLTNIRISQALVDKTTAAAANLQTIVDDTVKRYEEPSNRLCWCTEPQGSASVTRCFHMYVINGLCMT